MLTFLLTLNFLNTASFIITLWLFFFNSYIEKRIIFVTSYKAVLTMKYPLGNPPGYLK